MTKEQRRIRDFSSGIKKLGDESRNYIGKLTQVMFLIEQPPVFPVFEKKQKQGKLLTANRTNEGKWLVISG